MFKAIFFLKRKAGITHAQFRRHYENSHVKLADKYLGHLMTGYVRNYRTAVRGSRSLGRQTAQWDYDVITEWTLPNEEALEEIYRLFADPVIGKAFYDDEEHFLDRDATLVIHCKEEDVVDTGTGDGHGTLQLLGRGAPA
jgi:hypothetical protein